MDRPFKGATKALYRTDREGSRENYTSWNQHGSLRVPGTEIAGWSLLARVEESRDTVEHVGC